MFGEITLRISAIVSPGINESHFVGVYAKFKAESKKKFGRINRNPVMGKRIF